MSLKRVITHDEADYELLKLANEKGKFTLRLNYTDDGDLKHALERGIDAEWFTFVDISTTLTSPRKFQLLRVFKLTEKGCERLAELKQLFCDHRGYDLKVHGLRCYCSLLMTDFGD